MLGNNKKQQGYERDFKILMSEILPELQNKFSPEPGPENKIQPRTRAWE